MLWLLLTTAVCFLFWVYDRYSRRHMYRLVKKLPGLTQWPIVGNLGTLAGRPEHVYKVLQEIGSLSIRHKGVYTMWMGTELMSVLTDPDDIEKVLTTCLLKPHFYANIQDIMGLGLSTLPDLQIWKRHRKAILPSFNQTTLNSYIETFNIKSMDFVKKMDGHAGKGMFNISEMIAIATLDSICETVMGVPLEESDKYSKVLLYTALKEVKEMAMYRATRVWLWLDALYYRTAHGKLFKKYLDVVHKLPSTVILRKKEQTTNNLEVGSNDNGDASASNGLKHDLDKKSLLNRLLESSVWLTDKEISNEISTVMVAAYDTSNATASMALQAIGSYPEVQNKIVLELNTIFGGSERPITKKDLSNMTYLEYTIKETMRLYPSVPVYGRAIDRDVKLKHYTIPQGTSAYIFAGSVHTNEAIWGPDVMEFKPERWIPELSRKRHPCSFLPFSYGARNCIGFQYAMMFIKIILGSILRTYTVSSTIKSVVLDFAIVVGPKEGTLVQIEKRHEQHIST